MEGGDGVQMAISGYEADTIELDDFHLPVESRADAPPNFVAIAREAFAVMGYFKNGGTVFNGASTDYAAALTHWGDPVIQRLTQNAISTLNTPSASLLVDVHEMVGVSLNGSTFYYYSTSPFSPTASPTLQFSHTAFRGHFNAGNQNGAPLHLPNEKAAITCRLIPFYSWEMQLDGQLLQFFSPHTNASEAGDDRFDLLLTGFDLASHSSAFYAFDPACRPATIARLRLMPIFQYVATSPLRFRYSPSRLPALVQWTLTGAAFFVPADEGSSVCVSRAVTPMGSLYGFNVKSLPLSTSKQVALYPSLSLYEFVDCTFQVSTTRLHRGHVPVYRLRRLDEQTGSIHFRLTVDADELSEEWAVDTEATPRGDGVLFYATDSPDPTIFHSTAVYEYRRRVHEDMTAYAYDLGGNVSRLYLEEGYNHSLPLLIFHVIKPLTVSVYRNMRRFVTGTSHITSYAFTVSPFLFSFALHASPELYIPDPSLPSVRGQAGWSFSALAHPVADAIPVYTWFSMDVYSQRRYRLHPNLNNDDLVRGNDRTGNGWMLSTVDQPDAIAFYAFPSNHSYKLGFDLEAVYEVQQVASPIRYVYVTLVPASQLKALPPHYELVESQPLFWIPRLQHNIGH